MKNSKFFSIVCCFAMLFCMLGCENTTTNASGEYTFVANPNVPGAPIRNPANAAADDEVQVNIPSGGGSSGGGTAIPGLYKVADGYDISIWACWDGEACRITAVSENGQDGGVRLKSVSPTKCDGSYFGVNLAAGTGGGANADINPNGFSKISFKIRGTISSSILNVYALGAGENTAIPAGKPTIASLTSAYNATEWTTVTLDMGTTVSQNLTSALILGAENGATTDQWVEIKEIDWLDAEGNSVVPEYIVAE